MSEQPWFNSGRGIPADTGGYKPSQPPPEENMSEQTFKRSFGWEDIMVDYNAQPSQPPPFNCRHKACLMADRHVPGCEHYVIPVPLADQIREQEK